MGRTIQGLYSKRCTSLETQFPINKVLFPGKHWKHLQSMLTQYSENTAGLLVNRLFKLQDTRLVENKVNNLEMMQYQINNHIIIIQIEHTNRLNGFTYKTQNVQSTSRSNAGSMVRQVMEGIINSSLRERRVRLQVHQCVY